MLPARRVVGRRGRGAVAGRRSSLPVALASTSLMLLVLSCSAADIVSPSVTVDAVQLVAVGLAAERFEVTLCVGNPNRSALSFRRVTTELDVGGERLATGSSELPVLLPPLSSTTVPFAVDLTPENLAAQITDIARTGAIAYRIHGAVYLDGLFGLPVPYGRTGRLDVLSAGIGLVTSNADAEASACEYSARSGSVPTATPGVTP